jgi:Predicted xylanase/chitin deacetylase
MCILEQKKKLSFFIIVFLICTFMMGNKFGFEESKSRTAFSNINNKVIYLTFDDGPSSIVTNEILNILKQHHVKATFFVVGRMIEGRETVLRRIYNEGHSIGLHTYSHKHSQIYANEDQFIKEMIKTSEEIQKVIGIQPNIIRFPYGSNPYLNNTFLKKLHTYNFKVYDWNVSISDGIRPNTSPELFTREAITRGNGIPYVVFLMHCNNTNVNTYKALPHIIQHYKKLGYEFRSITNDTPEFYWHPSN